MIRFPWATLPLWLFAKSRMRRGFVSVCSKNDILPLVRCENFLQRAVRAVISIDETEQG